MYILISSCITAALIYGQLRVMPMARIFSIDFDYQQRQYVALVTASKSDGGDLQYVVAPYDDLLKELLPEGKINFNDPSDLRPVAEMQPKLHELVLSMTSALHRKLALTPG